MLARWRRALSGPAPVWPGWVEAVAEGWAGLSARGRIVLGVSGVVLCLAAASSWAAGVAERWGGAPVTVLIAERTLVPGELVADVRAVELPPAAVPADAVTELPEQARLAFALPAGAVLMRAHLDPRGAGAALPPGVRAMPIPVEEGWGVRAGGWVDVWVLGVGERPSRLVAEACTVLSVATAETGPGTALVALPEDAVEQVAQGLTLGRVLLAHAPPAG